MNPNNTEPCGIEPADHSPEPCSELCSVWDLPWAAVGLGTDFIRAIPVWAEDPATGSGPGRIAWMLKESTWARRIIKAPNALAFAEGERRRLSRPVPPFWVEEPNSRFAVGYLIGVSDEPQSVRGFADRVAHRDHQQRRVSPVIFDDSLLGTFKSLKCGLFHRCYRSGETRPFTRRELETVARFFCWEKPDFDQCDLGDLPFEQVPDWEGIPEVENVAWQFGVAADGETLTMGVGRFDALRSSSVEYCDALGHKQAATS